MLHKATDGYYGFHKMDTSKRKNAY